MPVITVTDELINIIKAERKVKNIKSAQLSSMLKKNTSFISQLERGNISELDLKTLYKIFDTLIPDENTRSDFVSNLLKKYSVKLTKEEIDNQQWMTVFDFQYRLIKLSDGVIESLNTEIKSLSSKGFSTKEIVNKINENSEIDNLSDYEDNKLYVTVDDEGETTFSIKLNIASDFIDKIINKEITKCNYVTILGIFYNLYKIQGFSKDDASTKAYEILYNNKFYTLLEKNNLIKINSLNDLSKEDREFKELTNDLIGFLNFLGDEDADFINEKLKVLLSNLESNLSLTLAIIGVSLDTLKELPYKKKKQFKEEYINLISKFELEKDNKIIERI